MTKYNIPFSPPDITEEEINEVVDTLKSGQIPYVQVGLQPDLKQKNWKDVYQSIHTQIVLYV